MQSSVLFLRRTALIEGVSFLVLLGIAMPLKHFANVPLAVKIAGWAHGILFVVFCAALWRVMRVDRWPVERGALVFAAGLLPFGPFVIDRRLAGWGNRNEESGRSGDRGERRP